MKKAFIGLLMLVVACAMPQTTETKEDSVATLSPDTLEVTSDEISPADTLYTTLEYKAPGGPFFDVMVAYVYNPDGLDVYEDRQGTKVVETIPYKSPVKLLEDLKATSDATMDGLSGSYVAIKFGDVAGYVFSGWLVNLPVPATDDVIEYFTTTLRLTAPVVEKKNRDEMGDGNFRLVDYDFGNGFKISIDEYYEGGTTEVMLGSLTMQQGYLLATHLYENFAATFTEFPGKGRDEEAPEQKHITVQLDGGLVTSMYVEEGQGCSWTESLSMSDEQVMMSKGGGC
jgi:hypothetical protein